MAMACEKPTEVTIEGSSSGDSLTGSSYLSAMRLHSAEGAAIIDDYEDLLRIWNATKNLDYGRSESSNLLGRVRSLLFKVGALLPPSNSKLAHELFISAFEAFEASLTFANRFYASDGTDENSLLQANLKILEGNDLLERFNEAN